MPFCKKCGTTIGNSDAFCAKCGTSQNDNVANNHTNYQQDNRRPRPPRVNAIDTKEGRARFDEIVSEKNSDASVKRKKRWTISAFLLALCLVTVLMSLILKVGILFIAGGILLIASLLMGAHAWDTEPDVWTETDYYSIPGSKNAHGEHRCIYCGNRGTYPHGAYASNIQYTDCTKCKKTLWLA